MIKNMINKFKYLIFLISFSIIIIFWILNLSYSKNSYPQNIEQTKVTSISQEDSIRCLNELVADIELLLNQSLNSKTKYSVLIYSLDQKKMIFSKYPDLMLTPASITKMFTTFTAFSELGADYKVQTSVYTDASEIKDSILNGNIYIVGYGDALFQSDDLNNLVQKITENGIKYINGNIIADGSFFDGKYYRKDYSGDRDEVEATPPISALAINNNTASIVVKGGAYVQVIPLSYTLQAISKLNTNTIKNKKSKIIQDKRKKTKNTTSLIYNNHSLKLKHINNHELIQNGGDKHVTRPYKKKSRITISSNLNERGIQLFYINGSIPKGKEFTYYYPLLKPELAVGGALKYNLNTNGIVLKGEIVEPKSNLLSEYKNYKHLATFERPLTEIIYPLVKNSNNYLAECVFKIIGAKLQLTADNARSARLAITRAFSKIGIFNPTCILNDGSGLSRNNKVTASAVLSILENAAKLNFADKFDSSLSVAGFDGTLKERMKGTLAEFNLHAKTGTLRDVSGLAGYVYTLDGERLAFVMLFNGPYVSNYKEIENKIGQLLAQFFYYNLEN